MSPLTSHQALLLTSSFVAIAERLRAAGTDLEGRAQLCEAASRVLFLRAHLLSKADQTRPAFGETHRRAAFAVT